MEDVPRTANEPRQVAASLGGCLTEGSKGRRIVAIPCAGRSEPEIRTELRLWSSRRNRRRPVSHLVAGTAGVSVTEAGDICSWRSREIFPEITMRTTSQHCRVASAQQI